LALLVLVVAVETQLGRVTGGTAELAVMLELVVAAVVALEMAQQADLVAMEELV
jgi:molybdenum-dependent DNA-binding transcriptional regulator ModE